MALAESGATREPGPTMRRRDLGRRLRRLREQAGRKAADAASYAGIQAGTLSRIETGRQVILPKNVRLLCQYYDVGTPLLDTLMRLADEASERGWWATYSDTIPDWFETYVGLESDASQICSHTGELVDGLLQTADYALAVMHAYDPQITDHQIGLAAELRKARQSCIDRQQPAELHVIMSEAALSRVVGGPVVMHEQLTHLRESSMLPNVTLQVLPFSCGAHAGMKTPFTILRFSRSYDMDAVYLENDRGALYLEKPGDLARYGSLFDRLAQLGTSPEESRQLIDNLLRKL